MSEKTKITEDRVISRSKGKVKFYADDGSIKTESSKQVQVFDNEDELNAAVEAEQAEPASLLEAEMAEEQAAGNDGGGEISNDEQSADDSPAAADGTSKPKRSKGKRKEQMATKKKATKKAAKKAVRTASNGALIRTVAGREHDISGYEKVKNSSGHTSYDNGDEIATKLRGKTLEEVYEFAAKKLGEPEKDLRAKYKHLNAGMQRMSLGNRLRKATQPKAA